MKTILIPALLLLVASCSSEDKSGSEEKQTKSANQSEANTDDKIHVAAVNHGEITGVYQNVGDPAVEMDLLHDGDNNYIARYRVNGQRDYYFPMVSGYMIEGDVFYHFSGPFQEIGPEGYFKMINNERCYYHELAAAYQSPEDTTLMLFKKISELDASRAITKEERNGLEGPVGMKDRYVIGIAKELKKSGNDWLLIFEKTPRDIEFDLGHKEFILKGKSSIAEVSEFLNTFSKDPKSVTGKMVKVVMLANGTPPGECFQEPNGKMVCSEVKGISLIE